MQLGTKVALSWTNVSLHPGNDTNVLTVQLYSTVTTSRTVSLPIKWPLQVILATRTISSVNISPTKIIKTTESCRAGGAANTSSVVFQSVSLFIYPTVQQQHKNEYQQNNVKHSDGLSEQQIAIERGMCQCVMVINVLLLVAQISTEISKEYRIQNS